MLSGRAAIFAHLAIESIDHSPGRVNEVKELGKRTLMAISLLLERELPPHNYI